MRPSSCNDARLTFYMMLKCIYTLVTLHKSKLPECIYTEGHIAFIPGRFALKHMYMLYCTFAMSDCISQMLKTHFGTYIFFPFEKYGCRSSAVRHSFLQAEVRGSIHGGVVLIFCLYDKCLFTALLRLCNNLYLKTLRFISSNMSISPEVARMVSLFIIIASTLFSKTRW